MDYYFVVYGLTIISLLITLLAQFFVSSSYSKYKKVKNERNLTGKEAARYLLDKHNLNDIKVVETSGYLTDHYDPANKVLRLSDSVYGSASIAAIGVAAHECGHAVQHQQGYAPLKIRSALVPAANIGSKAGIPIIILGALLGMNQVLIQIGIWVFALAVLFQVVTLPVEFNASGRALAMLGDYGMLEQDEVGGCRKVLKAAALTYVAAAASAILQLLRLVLLFGRRNDD